MRRAPKTLRAALPLTLLLAAAPAARADVFSPGDLSRAHAALEGLANCTKCHVAGERLAPERCLECHKELAGRVAQGKGFHGRIPAAERACERCHHEHQGRSFALVDFGPGGKKGFDHGKTGFELRGKHQRADCARCHDRRLVQDPALQELLGKQPERASFLGAPGACAACHFDEHRGQLGNECQRCHGEEAWKPAGKFQHAKSAYPLLGKHAKVECAKCHKEEPEAAARTAAPAQTPPVKPAAFVRYKGLPFQRCTDCHKDPHQGRFGAGERCTDCHTPADWKRLTGAAKERAFHEKTRYPLRGAHAAVKCEACHGPFPGVPAKFKGVAFERCTDCHADAHVGQLARLAGTKEGAAKPGGKGKPAAAGTPTATPAAAATCDACHGVEAWLPVRFEQDDHDRLEYRLEGAHRAVACALCHPKDPRLEQRVPAAERRELERRKRPVKVSLALLDIPKASDCRTCHRDPHAGQFKARLAEQGCAACHGLDSFRKPRFDHAKDSRYPLDGKHAQVACASCHRPDSAGVVRYKPLSLACASCHADPHAAQFAARGAPKGEATDCARCHLATGWKELRFKHAEPFTKFALEGKHAKAACEKCHPAVKLAGADVRRYRPLASACEGCHDDFHKGAFRAAGEATTRCAACHSAASWDASQFPHDKTGFPLVGAHRQASCRACHADARFQAPVARACAACHQDVHQGRLGRRCDRCHEPTSWASTTFDADVHRRSAFPLTGRHAVTPCESCHGDKRDRGFTRPTRECLACHEDDLARAEGGGAAVDHGAAGFPRTCQTCHSAWRFSPAGLPAHEACFQISSGEHAGIACTRCHTSLPPVDYTQPFTCQSDTAACTRCHSCSSHEPVQGFACVDRRCYECHRFSTGGDLRGAFQGGRR